MKTTILSALLFSALALSSCSKGGGGEVPPPVPPPEIADVNQSWNSPGFTIKTPIAKGDIVLTVPENIGGDARLVIPSGVTVQNNPTITIVFADGASFTGTLSITNADYAGTVILKQSAADKIAVGATSASSSQLLTVNLPKGSFDFARGKINGKASIATRPGTFTLGGVVAGDIIVEKGSVKIVIGGEVMNMTIKDNEPLVLDGKVSGTITVAAGASSPITISAGASVGEINAPQSTVIIQPSTTQTTSVGNVSGKEVTVGAGATTGDITISTGGKIKVDEGSTVNGSIDASDASSSQIDGTVTGEVKPPASSSSGTIDDWEDNNSTENGNPK